MIITLTTDFGLADPFVGIMKGVILGIAPNAQLIDLTHEVPAFDIFEAAFTVHGAYKYFPSGAIHVIVVDPGVGSRRRAVVAMTHGHIFVAPDNGVLSYVLGSEPEGSAAEVYSITNRSLFRDTVSHTFHGRDIFGPVAAHIARGIPVDSVGPRIADFMSRPFPRPRTQGDKLVGIVLRIDKFGNVVTNLRREDLGRDFQIRVAGLSINRLCATFSDADAGEFFAVEGSTGFIELALNQGSAAHKLDLVRGTEIEVETDSANQ